MELFRRIERHLGGAVLDQLDRLLGDKPKLSATGTYDDGAIVIVDP